MVLVNSRGLIVMRPLAQVVKPYFYYSYCLESLLVTHDWPIHQLDVRIACLLWQLLSLVFSCINHRGILERAHMKHCIQHDPMWTLSPKLVITDGDPIRLSFLLCNDPRDYILLALKAYFRAMFCGTLDHGLQLHVTLSCSSAEAEYRGVANVVVETAWIRNLLLELHTPLSTDTLVYYDNVRVLHVPSRFQYVDIFTKGIPTALFLEFRFSLNV
ncbi:ribonuclease H-like domain-containing protein [Tanacetum coccineum]